MVQRKRTHAYCVLTNLVVIKYFKVTRKAAGPDDEDEDDDFDYVESREMKCDEKGLQFLFELFNMSDGQLGFHQPPAFLNITVDRTLGSGATGSVFLAKMGLQKFALKLVDDTFGTSSSSFFFFPKLRFSFFLSSQLARGSTSARDQDSHRYYFKEGSARQSGCQFPQS